MRAARPGAFNLVAGVTLAALGILCHGAAGYLTLTRADRVEVRSHDADISACQRVLTSLGLETVHTGAELRAERRSLENPERLLADASLGLLACDLPLVHFCMGPACKAPAMPEGLSFSLSTVESSPTTSALEP